MKTSTLSNLKSAVFFFLLPVIILSMCSLKGKKEMEKNNVFLDYSQREVIVKGLEKQLENNLETGLESINTYRNHKSEDLRRDILAMVWRVTLRSKDLSVKHPLVAHLVEVATYETTFLQGQAVKFLQDFEKNDFNEKAIKFLEKLPLTGENGGAIIRLIGIADMQSKRKGLLEISGQKWKEEDSLSLFSGHQWAATLVLARFGSLEHTKRICERVQRESDIILRATDLFGDLAFTKQPLAFDTLRTFLNSKELLPQLKDTVPGQPEAKYAAVQFVQHIKGCPVKDTNIDKDGLESVRRWANEQTSWDIH